MTRYGADTYTEITKYQAEIYVHIQQAKFQLFKEFRPYAYNVKDNK